MRLLDGVDHKAIFSDPKPIIGMSDATSLQLSLFSSCRLISISGPMAANQIAQGLDDLSWEWLRLGLTTPWIRRNLFPQTIPLIKVVRHGRSRGALLPCCLTLLTSLLGTPYAPDFSQGILMIEDIGEPLYRLDRMLTHLKLAGALDSIQGLILGYFIGPDNENLSDDVLGILMELIPENNIPIICGFPFGHSLPNLAMPFGMPVELDTETLSIKVKLGLRLS